MNKDLTIKIRDYIKAIEAEKANPQNYNGTHVVTARKEGLKLIQELALELEAIKNKPGFIVDLKTPVVKFIKNRTKTEFAVAAFAGMLLFINSLNTNIIDKQKVVIDKQKTVIEKNIEIIDSLKISKSTTLKGK